jgi:hypothetical protein
MPADETILHEVFYSDTLEPPSDPAWTEAPHLICNSLTIGVSPTIDQAALTWHYGTMARAHNDSPDASMDYVAPLNLDGKYVRIEVPAKSITWYGYVLKSKIVRGPQETVGPDDRLKYGTQSFVAVGLEWFLDREKVNFSIVATDVRIERAIGFNCGFGTGRGLAYEDRANKESGASQFAADPTAAVLWDGESAVNYLLAKHQPKNAGGAPSPLFYFLGGGTDVYLDWFHPTIQTEGKTVYAVLNEIISKNRGLVWWIEVVEFFGELTAFIRVDSMSTGAIALPGGATLPANSNPTTLTDIDKITDGIVVTKDLARHYDAVIVRGARRRAVFTVSWISENLVEGWRSADEIDYRTALGADPSANDRYREANKFERVYQVFTIPTDWNGASNDGGSVPGSTDYACPKLAQGATSIVGAEPMNMPGLRLLSSLPTKVSYDYADATAPIARDPSTMSPEFQKPFGVINIGEGKFRFIHKLSTTEEDGQTGFDSYHLNIVEGTTGLQITGQSKLPHTLAKFTFDPEVDGASNVLPEFDYRELRFTVAAEWDAWCEGKYPLAVPANAPVQTLYISIGDRARHDWLAEGTIYDVEGDTLKTVATGGALRDDRELCVQVAQIAHQWYGVDRSELALDLRRIDLPANRGDLITSIGSGDVTTAVNAIVSQITFNFDVQTTNLLANFAELDFAGLA